MAKKKLSKAPEEIYFTDEPRGPAYSRLIDFAQKQCFKFSLVWREDLGNKKSDNVIAKELEEFVISDAVTSKWPGTELLYDTADVCTYKLNFKTSEILKKVKSLYQWEASEYPEDLAFYLKTGEIWMGSVAHEHIGWLCTSSLMASERQSLFDFLYNNGIIDKKYEI